MQGCSEAVPIIDVKLCLSEDRNGTHAKHIKTPIARHTFAFIFIHVQDVHRKRNPEKIVQSGMCLTRSLYLLEALAFHS